MRKEDNKNLDEKYQFLRRYGFVIIAVLFFIVIILVLHLINLLTTYSLVTG